MDVWLTFHNESKALADRADEAVRQGDRQTAFDLYREAARVEETGLSLLPRRQSPILSLSLVNSVSLYIKARDILKALSVADLYLGMGLVPPDVQEEVLAILREHSFIAW